MLCPKLVVVVLRVQYQTELNHGLRRGETAGAARTNRRLGVGILAWSRFANSKIKSYVLRVVAPIRVAQPIVWARIYTLNIQK